MSFPENFFWGAATSSYQIEGAAFEDGKGTSIWDDFCQEDERIFEHHNGNIACDHYHHFKEDVKIMSEIGIKAYRLSISWTRILPGGIGKVNEKGLMFYSNLIDELLAYGITPFVTLFHWDYPAALQQSGGWLNEESPKWFEEYVRIVVARLGDRVKHYITFNEPQCIIGHGFIEGIHAPGTIMPIRDTIRMSHHLLLAHGLAVKALRELCPDCKIGYAPTSTANYPMTETPGDIEAAKKSLFSMESNAKNWAWNVTWWSDPVMLGTYPKDGLKLYEKYLPNTWIKDMETIYQPLDFYGQNIYHGNPVQDDGYGGYKLCRRVDGYAKTAIGWPVTPKSLYWGPKFLYDRYQKPILITENGMSCHDVISLDGKVHDPNRIDFLHRYLLELRKATDDGTEVLGYFHWSLLDNFEWAMGYHDRFGLVYVDYQTQRRVLKDSAFWYKEVICSNGALLDVE